MNHQPVIQAQWIDMFVEVFRLCGVQAGDACAVLSESLTRPDLPQLSMLALQRIGARPFQMVMPGRALQATSPAAPIRSTGASDAIHQLGPVVQALAACVFVADCTVEGLQHAAELPQILAGGARVLAISHEHPEILERCLPRAEDEAPVRDAMRRMKSAKVMQVTSKAGTDLKINLVGARIGGVWGFTSKPGTLSHWPGGLVLAFPAAGTVNGTLVMDRGDVNLTFKRYLQDAVKLSIHNDHAISIEGEGFDAELMRGYLQSFATGPEDRAAYAVSHLGWGLNRRARWDAMNFYDKADFNGTELRAFAGNFLYSTGANEVAARHTLGHFDLPLRGCTVMLDGVAVVEAGRLL
jgi:2,5-dihydroxypyridine 5,6-dioxygenase